MQTGRFVILLAVIAALTGCAEKKTTDPFIDHWKEQSVEHQGFSPSVTDLNPAPRVVMQYTDSWDGGGQRSLPTTPVTLKLHNVDVNVVLRSLAAAAGVNVLVSPGVSGTASLNVQSTPWKDVFLSILRANGLEYRWQGNILQVLTSVEKQKEINMLSLNNELSKQRTLQNQGGPMSVSVINVRYSDVDALKASLTSLTTNIPGTVVEIDQHSNALIVQAPASQQKRILALVDNLDRPRPQVHLRAYIVEATKEAARELGVKWGGIMRTSANGVGNRAWVGSTGDATFGTDPVVGGFGTSQGLAGVPMGLDYATQAGLSGAGAVSFMFGAIGNNLLETQLNMMEKKGVLNILSSPSITTLDNKMAYTENGEKVPYVSTNKDGDTEVKFEDAVLRLEMTPNVIDSNNLKMKILVKKDEVDSSRSVEGNPYILKKQTETTLIMRSSETIVISGLTKEKGTNTVAGVPGTVDVPVLQHLFGASNRGSTLEEVLIFITPEILPTRTVENAQIMPLPPSPPTLAPERNAPQKNYSPAVSEQ